jgi:hypothetical protein
MADQPPPDDLPEGSARRRRNLLLGLLALVILIALAGGGYAISRGKPAATAATTPSVTASATASATASPAATTAAATRLATAPPTAPPSCPPAGLTHPLDPLGPGTGSDTGVGATGCDEGTVPADGTPFLVPAGWGWSSSATCTGSAGADGMGDTLDFTAHNTDTNTDLAPVNNDGPWSYDVQSGAAGDGSSAPAGHYIIRVSRPNPSVNHCQWKIEVYRGLGH